jgi:hypothetical protein
MSNDNWWRPSDNTNDANANSPNNQPNNRNNANAVNNSPHWRGIPVHGSEFIILPGELPDFPEQTLMVFPALPNRGEYIVLDTRYRSNALSNDTNGSNTSNNGNNGGLANLNNSNLLNSSGNSGTVTVKPPQTGQGMNTSRLIFIVSISVVAALIAIYIKNNKRENT